MSNGDDPLPDGLNGREMGKWQTADYTIKVDVVLSSILSARRLG